MVILSGRQGCISFLKQTTLVHLVMGVVSLILGGGNITDAAHPTTKVYEVLGGTNLLGGTSLLGGTKIRPA